MPQKKGTVERVIRRSNVHRAWHIVQRGEKDIACGFISEWDVCRYVILAFDKNKDKKIQFLLSLDDRPDDEVNEDGLPYLPTYDKMVSWDDHNNITIDGRYEIYNRRSSTNVFSDIRQLIAEVGLENIKLQINELKTTSLRCSTNHDDDHDASVHSKRPNGQDDQTTDFHDACVQSNHQSQVDKADQADHQRPVDTNTANSPDHADPIVQHQQKKRPRDFDLVAHAHKHLRRCQLMVKEEERSKERIRKLQEEENQLKECIRKMHVVMDKLESVIRQQS